ncbi:hypothetical protein, partial [Bradyrhizobium sp. WYCCWR 12699]|uniref:hypothetical protein n=1 Tax=Bradyrhizobium sp. WYCCWR 12699 TaxID=3064203 RepID=UPI0028A6B88E
MSGAPQGRRFLLRAKNEARTWRLILPGLATGDALGDVASVRIAEMSARSGAEPGIKLVEQADARLTGRAGG